MHFLLEEYIMNEILFYESEKFPGLSKNTDQRKKAYQYLKGLNT